MSAGTIAAIDCGTNTIKLLIGALPDVVVRETRMVRLGQGVDATGRLADEALVRAFAAIDDYAALIAAHPVERIRFCATSATRDASNAEEFAAGVHARLGVWPEVVSGAEEAALSFDGAVRNLRTPLPSPTLVIDIGGGRPADPRARRRHPTSAASLDLGSVRLTERHLHSDPPTAGEVAACVADIEAHLDRRDVDLATAAAWSACAGTVITVASGLSTSRCSIPTRTDQAVVPVADVHSYVERLARLSVAERRALPYMHPGRADVIIGGALILDRVLRRTPVATMTVLGGGHPRRHRLVDGRQPPRELNVSMSEQTFVDRRCRPRRRQGRRGPARRRGTTGSRRALRRRGAPARTSGRRCPRATCRASRRRGAVRAPGGVVRRARRRPAARRRR